MGNSNSIKKSPRGYRNNHKNYQRSPHDKSINQIGGKLLEERQKVLESFDYETKAIAQAYKKQNVSEIKTSFKGLKTIREYADVLDKQLTKTQKALKLQNHPLYTRALSIENKINNMIGGKVALGTGKIPKNLSEVIELIIDVNKILQPEIGLEIVSKMDPEDTKKQKYYFYLNGESEFHIHATPHATCSAFHITIKKTHLSPFIVFGGEINQKDICDSIIKLLSDLQKRQIMRNDINHMSYRYFKRLLEELLNHFKAVLSPEIQRGLDSQRERLERENQIPNYKKTQKDLIVRNINQFLGTLNTTINSSLRSGNYPGLTARVILPDKITARVREQFKKDIQRAIKAENEGAGGESPSKNRNNSVSKKSKKHINKLQKADIPCNTIVCNWTMEELLDGVYNKIEQNHGLSNLTQALFKDDRCRISFSQSIDDIVCSRAGCNPCTHSFCGKHDAELAKERLARRAESVGRAPDEDCAGGECAGPADPASPPPPLTETEEPDLKRLAELEDKPDLLYKYLQLYPYLIPDLLPYQRDIYEKERVRQERERAYPELCEAQRLKARLISTIKGKKKYKRINNSWIKDAAAQNLITKIEELIVIIKTSKTKRRYNKGLLKEYINAIPSDESSDMDIFHLFDESRPEWKVIIDEARGLITY